MFKYSLFAFCVFIFTSNVFADNYQIKAYNDKNLRLEVNTKLPSKNAGVITKNLEYTVLLNSIIIDGNSITLQVIFNGENDYVNIKLQKNNSSFWLEDKPCTIADINGNMYIKILIKD